MHSAPDQEVDAQKARLRDTREQGCGRLVRAASHFALERRGWVLVVFAALTAAFVSQLPALKVDTSPEALVSQIEGQEEAEALFEQRFGRSESQVLVAVEAPNVLTPELLRYQQRLHLTLDALDAVQTVDGITRITLPAELPERPPTEPEIRLPDDLPEAARALARKEAEKRRAEEKQRRIERAQREGVLPSDEQLKALVRNEASAFPGGWTQLRARFLGAEAGPALPLEGGTLEQLEAFGQAAAAAEFLVPSLISRDHTATLLVAHLNPNLVVDEVSRMQALADVRAATGQLQAPDSARLRYGGGPLLGEAILAKLEKDRFVLNPAMGLVCLAVLLFTFRWWVAVVAPLLAVGVAALGVMGSLALFGVPLTILTNIIPPLLLIVGLSDSVHLLGRYREEVRQESDRMLAGRRATAAMLVACFLTSLTTAVGFGSLASAKTDELARFGLAASGGVVLAYLATVFVVPAFCSYFSVPLAWREEPGTRHRPSRVEQWIVVLTRTVLRHFRWVTALAVVMALLFSWAASRVVADARLMDAFDADEEVSQTVGFLEKQLTGIRPMEVVLQADDADVLLEPEVTRRLSEVLRALRADSEVISTFSYVDQIQSVRATLTPGADSERAFSSVEQTRTLADLLQKAGGPVDYLTEDRKSARATVFFRDSGIVHTLEAVEQFEEALRPVLQEHGVRWTLLGEAYTGSQGRAHVLGDLLGGLALALVIIFALLALLFRSIPLGLVAMPPNVIPLLATGAYMMARGIQLNLTTVITFSIGIGLAVDDTVHVVARFREESRRVSSVRVALLRAARGTGTAIFVTAVSLSLGFSVLMLSEFVSVRQFGELIAVTVLNCLVGALVIQPALLLLVTRSQSLSVRAR